MQDWDVLRYVLAIARHGGLSGAARALNTTHATVSRQLARAEESLGHALFLRAPSGLTPTEAGKAAVARAKAVEDELIALDRALAGRESGPLAITVPPIMMRTHLAADLRDLSVATPGLALSILSDNRVFNLHRREADVAIRVTASPDENLWGRKIADQRAGYFATPDFIDRHRDALDGASGRVPVVGFTAWRYEVPVALKKHLPGAYRATTSDDLFTGIELVKAGFGLTRMPFFAARTEPVLQWIEQLPVPDYRPVWLLTHPDLRHAPNVQLAMRFLAERFARMADTYVTPPAFSD